MQRILANPLLLTGTLLIIVAVAIWGVLAVTQQPDLSDGAKVPLKVDRTRLTATVAASDASRFKGVAGLSGLADDKGMLFVLESSQIADFTMRNVTFPIDIIWIADETVTEVTPNIQPQPGVAEDRLQHYSPSGPVNRVLEVQAGWAAKHSVQPGDPVRVLSF